MFGKIASLVNKPYVTIPTALGLGGIGGAMVHGALSQPSQAQQLAEEASQYSMEYSPDYNAVVTPLEQELVLQQALFKQKRDAELNAIKAEAARRINYEQAQEQVMASTPIQYR